MSFLRGETKVNNKLPARIRPLIKKALNGKIQLVTFFVCWLGLPVAARGQFRLQVVTDHTTYNAGTIVRARVVFGPPSFPSRPVQFLAAVRYAGERTPIVPLHSILSSFIPSAKTSSTPYVTLWSIPSNALTGRYEIDLTARDPTSGRRLAQLPDAGAFVVHRLRVKIVRIRLGRTFYTSGDSVNCQVTLRNP